MAAAALLAGLGGCQGKGAIGAGVDLFHDLQGGAIAEQRPPPPGVNDPFPNLGAIPKRPPPPDVLAEQRIADQLASQRDQAEQDAAANPLTPRQPPPAAPKKAAAPDPNANRVVVDAAPTPTPTPPPKPATATPPTPPAASVPSLASVPAVAAPLVSGPLPSIAAAPPASPIGLGLAPVVPGAGGSPTTTPNATATAAAPASVPAAAAAAVAAAATPKPLIDRLLSQTVTPITPGDTIYKAPAIPVTSTVAISFTPGSAELPPSAPLNLRRFALAHKGVAVTITGHGEAVLPGADSQSRALDLALRRAQAIAASLASNGIPAVNLHLHAEAAGLGGSVSL